jgi:hypothetical protein
MAKPDGMTKKYTFSGSVYFQRMLALDLYTTDHDVIADRVASAGLSNVFASRVMATA